MAGSRRAEMACSAGRGTARATLCLAVVSDSDAVTAAMDTEAELISATVPAPSFRAAMKSNPGPPMALWNAAKAEPQVALFGRSHQLGLLPWRSGCPRERVSFPPWPSSGTSIIG